MRILTYKRTHIGDPDHTGRFGIHDCMGKIRNFEYDAVIGVGGVGVEPQNCGIARKINWVGINPSKSPGKENKDVEVTFEYFLLLEAQGPLLEELAPLLARRMYEKGVRILLSGYSANELFEAKGILEWAKTQTSGQVKEVYQAGGNSRCKRQYEPTSQDSTCKKSC